MRFVTLFVLLMFAAPVEAQMFRTPKPDACTLECPAGPPGPHGDPGRDGRDGKDGRDGRDGVDGKDGRDGLDAEVGPRVLRPFDLWIRGIVFNASAVVKDGAKTYLLVYAAQFPAAALVDVETGLAQVRMGFDAGVGPDPNHPGDIVRFDRVEVLAPRSFLWWHRGAGWSETWPENLPWEPMLGFKWR